MAEHHGLWPIKIGPLQRLNRDITRTKRMGTYQASPSTSLVQVSDTWHTPTWLNDHAYVIHIPVDVEHQRHRHISRRRHTTEHSAFVGLVVGKRLPSDLSVTTS